MTLAFGQANLQSVSGLTNEQRPQAFATGWEEWTYYLAAIPGQVGWAATLAAGVGAVLLIRTQPGRHISGYVFTAGHLLLLAWFVLGYLFFTAIDLKEIRNSVIILPPVAVAAGLAFDRLFAKIPRAAALGVVLIGALTVVQTVAGRPIKTVEGYRDVAAWVADHAPRGSVVVFSGRRDGAFIFNMREREDRRDLSVVRADKLLLRIAIRRELGYEEIGLSQDEIAERLNALGVRYVVAEPDFWVDIAQMQRLQDVLHGPQFEEVARLAIRANYPGQETELVVFRNRAEIAQGPIDLTVELPTIGRAFSGSIAGEDAR
jgi:hypothetical protein